MWLRSCRPTAPALANANSRSRNCWLSCASCAYEDWTFRETEVRLSEHGELRRALALASVPDYTTLQPFLRRLLEPDLEHALEDSRASRGAGEAAKANHGGRRCHRA